MSIRLPFRVTAQASRAFSSASAWRAEAGSSSGSGESSHASSSSSGFAALSNIFSAPSTSSASISSTPRTLSDATSPESLLRGYAPTAIPPKIDPILDLFTNMLMKHGRKAESQRRVANILSMIQTTANQPPVPLLHRAVQMASPSVKLISIKKSMKTTPAPRALDERQRTHQGIAWIFKAAESGRKAGSAREVRIARELLKVLEGESSVLKMVEDRHRAAALARSNIRAR